MVVMVVTVMMMMVEIEEMRVGRAQGCRPICAHSLSFLHQFICLLHTCSKADPWLSPDSCPRPCTQWSNIAVPSSSTEGSCQEGLPGYQALGAEANLGKDGGSKPSWRAQHWRRCRGGKVLGAGSGRGLVTLGAAGVRREDSCRAEEGARRSLVAIVLGWGWAPRRWGDEGYVWGEPGQHPVTICFTHPGPLPLFPSCLESCLLWRQEKCCEGVCL